MWDFVVVVYALVVFSGIALAIGYVWGKGRGKNDAHACETQELANRLLELSTKMLDVASEMSPESRDAMLEEIETPVGMVTKVRHPLLDEQSNYKTSKGILSMIRRPWDALDTRKSDRPGGSK